MVSIEDLRRRQASMEAARRMSSQAGLPAPCAKVRLVEDLVVIGELTVDEAVAEVLRAIGRGGAS